MAYLLNESEHIYWISDLDMEVHSIWDIVYGQSGLQECKGQAKVGGLDQGQGMSGLSFFSVAPAHPHDKYNARWRYLHVKLELFQCCPCPPA